jgi:hypothetical protein
MADFGTTRTSRDVRVMSAVEGKTDSALMTKSPFWHKHKEHEQIRFNQSVCRTWLAANQDLSADLPTTGGASLPAASRGAGRSA